MAHYLHALDVGGIVDAVIPRRGRALDGHGEITAVLAASRLCSPAPLYDIAGWASSAAVAELLGVPAALLNDDRLGRSLEALAPAAETVRGKLLLAAVRRFAVADASRLHLDLTAVRFAGSYAGSGLVARGWSADRTIARQVKTLQATTLSGAAVYFRPHNGSANELPAFMAAIEAQAAALPPGLVVVADSGLGYLENLCAADDAHVKFVVPLRADTRLGSPVRRRYPRRPARLAGPGPRVLAGTGPARKPAHHLEGNAGAISPSPAPSPAPATTCGQRTSGPQKKPPPSPPPASVPGPRPRPP